MSLKHVPILQKKTISQDGLFQKLHQGKKKNMVLIETRLMTQGLHSVDNATQRIKQQLNVILGHAIEIKEINLVLSKVKCKVLQQSSYSMLSGE